MRTTGTRNLRAVRAFAFAGVAIIAVALCIGVRAERTSTRSGHDAHVATASQRTMPVVHTGSVQNPRWWAGTRSTSRSVPAAAVLAGALAACSGASLLSRRGRVDHDGALRHVVAQRAPPIAAALLT